MDNPQRKVIVVGAGSGIGDDWDLLAHIAGVPGTAPAGPVETPILPDFEASMGKEMLDTVRDTVGRHAVVDDIVPLIDFLGSAQAGWITGQDILIDGGFVTAITAGAPIAV